MTYSAWLMNCYDELYSKLEPEEQIILRAFLTQYEIRANKLLAVSSIKAKRERFNSWRQGLKRQSGPISLKSDSNPVDVLFWPWQKLHVDVSSGIVSSLKSSNALRVSYLSHNPPIQKYLRDAGLLDGLEISPEVLPPNGYKKNGSAQKILDKAKALPSWKADGKTLLFSTVIKDAFHHWFGIFTLTRQIFRQVVSQNRPHAIFVGNDLTVAGSTIVRLAKQENILTYSIMHGAIKNDLWRYSEVDQLFVFGERDKELMISRGIEKNKLIVSGSPKVEIESRNTTQTLPKRYRDLNFHLIALSGPGHSVTLKHHGLIINCLESLVKAFPKENFIFKLHKKDSANFYRSISQLPNAWIMEYDHPDAALSIYTWIRHARCLITGASASALDAMAMQVPVVTVDCLGDLSQVAYIKEGVSLHCKSTQELKAKFKIILDDVDALSPILVKMKEFADSCFAKPKVGSIELITQKIESDLKQKN